MNIKGIRQLADEVEVISKEGIVEQTQTYEILDEELRVIDGLRVKVHDRTSKQVLFNGIANRGEFAFTVSFDVNESTDPHLVHIAVVGSTLELEIPLDEKNPEVAALVKRFREQLVLVQRTVEEVTLVQTRRVHITQVIAAPLKHSDIGPRAIEPHRKELPPPPPFDSKPDPDCPEAVVPPLNYNSMSFNAVCADLERQYQGRLATLTYFGLIDDIRRPTFTKQLRGEVRFPCPTFDEIRRLFTAQDRLQRAIRGFTSPLLIVTPFGLNIERIADAISSKHGQMVGDEVEDLRGTKYVGAHGPVRATYSGLLHQNNLRYHPEYSRGSMTKDEILFSNGGWNHFRGWLVLVVNGEQEVQRERDLDMFIRSGNRLSEKWKNLGFARITPEESLMLHAEGVVAPFENQSFNHLYDEFLPGATFRGIPGTRHIGGTPYSTAVTGFPTQRWFPGGMRAVSFSAIPCSAYVENKYVPRRGVRII